MPGSQQHYPVKLTQAQRKAVAEVAPELTDRLKQAHLSSQANRKARKPQVVP